MVCHRWYEYISEYDITYLLQLIRPMLKNTVQYTLCEEHLQLRYVMSYVSSIRGAVFLRCCTSERECYERFEVVDRAALA